MDFFKVRNLSKPRCDGAAARVGSKECDLGWDGCPGSLVATVNCNDSLESLMRCLSSSEQL